VCDQLVDRTSGRAATFFDGPESRHISLADPYCEELRSLAVDAIQRTGATVHGRATVVVISGPRFSTRAESRFYSTQGWGVVNMTQAPEVALTRELDMCYVNISVVTDYDAGVVGGTAPVTHDEVLRQLGASVDTLREGVGYLIAAIAAGEICPGHGSA